MTQEEKIELGNSIKELIRSIRKQQRESREYTIRKICSEMS